MLLEVARMIRRPGAREIGGCGSQDAPVWREPPGDKPAVGQRADPDGGVETFPDKVGELHLDADLWVCGEELGQDGRDPEPPESRRKREAQPSLRLGSQGCGFRLGLDQAGHQVPHAAMKRRTGLGQCHPPRRALEEPDV